MRPVPAGARRRPQRPPKRFRRLERARDVRLALALLACLLIAGAATAQAPGGAPGTSPGAATRPGLHIASPPFQVRATLRPAVAGLGQRVLYQGWVLRPGSPGWARWLPADTSASFTWGAPTVRQHEWYRRKKVDPAARHRVDGSDTLFIEIPLQAFALGRLTVPGVRVELDDGRGPRVYRLPVVKLDVMPVLTAADSNADYRTLHGPLAAPWWEQVPWRWVVFGVLMLAAAIALIFLWRARRGKSVPAAAPAAVPLEPRAEALAALAALRSQHLPEHGRFAEHAFQLGRILRRFLESTTDATRPGDTTPELVAHLRVAGLEPDDLTRLSGLLRIWDGVKFAREPFTLEEAVRAERAIEMFLRRPPGLAEQVA